MKFDGFDNVQRELKKLGERAQALHGTHTVTVTELLTPEFIQDHTRGSETAEQWFAASPFKIETTADLEAVPDAEWDAYVRTSTHFASWMEMLTKASEEMIARKLFE